MNRREIPRLGMFDYGQEHLRRQGFVAMPFLDSLSLDPARLSPHFHDFYQVSRISGDCRLMHDFRETDVNGETLFFLSPGQVHTMRPGREVRGTIISFTREFIDHPSGILLDLPFFQPATDTPWLELAPDAAAVAHALFDEMQAEFDAALPHSEEVLRALLTLLLVRSIRWHDGADNKNPRTRTGILVRQFHQEVANHYLEWQTLAPYARSLGVTTNHLNDVVREATGTPPGEHIRARRLLDAKRMLLHSSLSVSEIGYRLGFKDPSYFSRFFRRYEDATPAAFRNQIREKYQNEPD